MKRYIIMALLFLVSLQAFAQADKKEVRSGNRQFRKGEYRQSDVSYRKALLKDSTSVVANYDLASNLYRQQNYDEAAKYIAKTENVAPGMKDGEKIFFNQGDIAIARQDWKGAVDAFKKAMLMDPEDIQAKENYIYAKKKLEEQQNQDQDQNQDQQDQNQHNQDQNQDPSNEPSGDPSQDPSQDQQNQDNQDQPQDRQKQPRPQDAKISPQQAQQMLKAIQDKEKETQDKVNKEKAEAAKAARKDKNW